ncbi:uncharacterized protein [Dermacentor albipictus]|uniref:uncharacterized protein n=1 Tax=Dermacentor albipictus TaxID=60249 RepID=UPI0038FC5B2C
MSPEVPLYVQVCASILILASATSPVMGDIGRQRSDSLAPIDEMLWQLPGFIADAHRRAANMTDHRLVENGLCAPSMSTVTSLHRDTSRSLPAINLLPRPTIISGHGSPAVTMSPEVPLYVQVSAKRYGFRGDYLCLVVLPCPQVLLDCVCDCFSMACILLKLSGDVEENPGPISQATLNEILQTQKDILAKVTQIQEKQTSSEAGIVKMQTRLDSIEAKLVVLEKSQIRLSNIESTMSDCQAEIDALAKQVDGLENQSRRSNLIVRGILEEANENEETLLKKVNDDVFEAKLGEKLSTIERIHRLGKVNPGNHRPVILRIGDFREKTKIMNNCYKLKGRKISISEDYSKRVHDIRKKLWNTTVDERKNGAKVKMVFDKMKVNKILYAWDETTKQRYKCHTPSGSGN